MKRMKMLFTVVAIMGVLLALVASPASAQSFFTGGFTDRSTYIPPNPIIYGGATFHPPDPIIYGGATFHPPDPIIPISSFYEADPCLGSGFSCPTTPSIFGGGGGGDSGGDGDGGVT